jgi:transposase-like protein
MPNKTIPSRAILAQHLADGMTISHIAETYGVLHSSVRRRLVRFGLVTARQQHPNHVLARSEDIRAEAEEKAGVILKDDRITFMRETAWSGCGSKIRPLSLPRPSMYLAAIGNRYPNLRGTANV